MYKRQELTHTRDNRLTSLLVGLNGEGWVFFSQLGQTVRELVEVLLSLRLNGDTDNWIREVHRFQYDWCVFVSQSVTSVDILETYTCTDITSADFVNWVLVV